MLLTFQQAFERKELLENNKYELRRKYDAQYKSRIAEIYAEKFPKRHPEKLKKFADLEESDRALYVYAHKFNAISGSEEQVAAYNYYKELYTTEYTILEDNIKELRNFLIENSNTVTEYPQTKEFIELEKSSTDTYRSQGWGASKYALGPLNYYSSLLTEAGIENKIITTDEIHGRDNYGYPYYSANYRLMAKCEKWVWRAIFLNLGNIDKWNKSDYNNGVNSKVYMGG